MEMGYAADLHREALIATAVVLFVFILIINLAFSLMKRRCADVMDNPQANIPATLAAYKRSPFPRFCFYWLLWPPLLTLSVSSCSLVVYILVKGSAASDARTCSPGIYNSENVSMLPAIVNTVTMTVAFAADCRATGYVCSNLPGGICQAGQQVCWRCTHYGGNALWHPFASVYGLFGLLFFVIALNWGYSILAGAFTLAMMILPRYYAYDGGSTPKRAGFLS